MLNDKNAGVSKASVLALQNLYHVDNNVPNLGTFTVIFSRRLIELVNDVDVSVTASVIGLVKELFRHELLSDDDDIGPLYDLLIDDQPEIRHGTGELLYDHLISQKYNGSKGRNGSKIHLARVLKILYEFSTDPLLNIYVIDNVWGYMKGMKDWKCIISVFLDKKSTDDATNLVRLLFASVRKAVGEKIVPALDNRK